MNKDEARLLFSNKGLTYKDIGSKEVAELIKMIELELSNSENNLQMKICDVRKSDIKFKEDGTLKNLYLMVDGFYFKRREAISFNTENIDGQFFIGFAGWASTENYKPFINAFVKWVDFILEQKNK